MKKRKDQTPLTGFGKLLKNAISKPFRNEKEPKLSESPKETSKSQQVNSEYKPSNSTSGNSPRPENTKTSVSQPIAKTTEKPNEKLKSPVHVNQVNSGLSDNEKIIRSAANQGNPKFANLMRERFWQNIDGECPSGHRGRPLRINLGIDLGTSFSKVVFRVGDEAYPVLFGENRNKIEDFLYPSVLIVGKGNITTKFELSAELQKLKHAEISNFKICLTCEKDSSSQCEITKCGLSNCRPGYVPGSVLNEEATFLTAFFIGKLIAKSKQQVREQLPGLEIPDDITVKWSANIAVPDKFLDSEVAHGFKETFEIAWLMSEVFLKYPRFEFANSKEDIATCYIEAKELHLETTLRLANLGKEFDCFAYSEIGAEVASVTLSPTSEDGLYVLVDVGAGTVDTSVFRFVRDREGKRQETYAADIVKLGAAQIDAKANSRFMRRSLNWFKQLKENAFRQRGDDPLIHLTDELKNAEDEVVLALKEKLIAVYREAYSKENKVEVWAGLRLIMGGGGSAIESYGNAARQSFSPKLQDSVPIEFSTLKVPSDFHMETLPTNQFHRFAVAYGLSHSLLDLPEVVSSDRTAPLKRMRQKEYIDPTNDG